MEKLNENSVRRLLRRQIVSVQDGNKLVLDSGTVIPISAAAAKELNQSLEQPHKGEQAQAEAEKPKEQKDEPADESKS